MGQAAGYQGVDGGDLNGGSPAACLLKGPPCGKGAAAIRRQGDYPARQARRPPEGAMMIAAYGDVFFPNRKNTPQAPEERFTGGLRLHKLRIARHHLSVLPRSLRCSSFSHRKHFVGLRREPWYFPRGPLKTTQRGKLRFPPLESPFGGWTGDADCHDQRVRRSRNDIRELCHSEEQSNVRIRVFPQ